jgi:hypothetical protein
LTSVCRCFVRCEQPAKHVRLVEPTVEEQGQGAAQTLDDLIAVKEGGRYRLRPCWTFHGEELVITEELLHSPD